MISIFNYFLENKLVVNMCVLFILLVGGYSMLQLRQEEMPDADLATMNINVIYPGASPSDVELNALVPIERKLAEINGIDGFTSIALENRASISVQIDDEIGDTKAVKDEIYRQISLSSIPDIPSEVEDIIIVDINPKIKNILSIVVYPSEGQDISEAELFDYAYDFADDLNRIEGVSEITKTGWREREIHIDVDPVKARNLDLSLNQIVSSIRARNIRSTGGTIQSLTNEKTIVTIGQFEEPLDVGDVIIRSNYSGQKVRIKDIAKIRDDFKESSTRVSVNGKQGVVLGCKKNEHADIVETVANIKAFLENHESMNSEKFTVEIVKDSSLAIISLLNVVKSNAFVGFLLVALVLLIFLDRKTALWTAFGLPISLAIVFIYMYYSDISLNRISLIAIITVLGMLVDDGIVIAERIFHNKQIGMKPLDAVRKGMSEVIAPVLVSITTTIVAFLPMLTIGGPMGKFISIFPIIVSAMLIASLFEATLFLPNHLATPLKKKKTGKDWFTPVKNVYKAFLKRVLRFRYVVVIFFIILFGLSIKMSQDTIQNFQLMPSRSSNLLFIDLEASQGTSLDKMTELTTELEKVVVKTLPEDVFLSAQSTIGKHEASFFAAQTEYENWSTITINLTPVNERKVTAKQAMKLLKKQITMKKYPEFTSMKFRKQGRGPQTGSAVELKLIGDNPEQQEALLTEMQEFLNTIKGVKNINTDLIDGKQELAIVFKYEKLAEMGLTVQDVAQTVRTAYDGTIATSIETSDEKLDFRVKVDNNYQRDDKYLLSLRIPNSKGRLIRLADIAYIQEKIGKANINHYDGDRAVTLSADVNAEIITPAQATKSAFDHYKTISKNYPKMTVEISGESKETKETLGDLLFAYIIAILLIFAMLVLLFKSVSQPFMVMFVVPFGIIGALIAFTLHGLPLSFMGIIGIIGLSGVVVNDSVIMIDFINGIFRKNKSRDKVIEAIVDGAKERLRPVLLTTITTVAGLLPTVYGFLGESELIAPVAMAMSYGLLFATTLTLIFIPAVYMVNEDIQRLFSRKTKEVA